MNIVDSLAQSLVGTPDFKGKWRLVDQWAARRQRGVRKIGAAKLELDLRTPYEHVVWLRREEEVDLRRLRSLLNRGDVFVDCGANIGLWTLSAAEAVGPEGTVFAIEPHPNTFRRLSAHVATLPAGNVRLINKAADSLERTLQFDIESDHNRARVGQGSGEVHTVRLDDVVERAHGIKIDVEGHELDVIKGASRILSDHAPWICIEFNTEMTGSGRLGDWAVHQYLKSFGYTVVELTSGETCDDTWTLNSGYTNLLYGSGPRGGVPAGQAASSR